jgi:flagellar motor component MotA
MMQKEKKIEQKIGFWKKYWWKIILLALAYVLLTLGKAGNNGEHFSIWNILGVLIVVIPVVTAFFGLIHFFKTFSKTSETKKITVAKQRKKEYREASCEQINNLLKQRK